MAFYRQLLLQSNGPPKLAFLRLIQLDKQTKTALQYAHLIGHFSQAQFNWLAQVFMNFGQSFNYQVSTIESEVTTISLRPRLRFGERD